jgi:hypothetical protein
VLHARAKQLPHTEFLARIGLSGFDWNCPFFGRHCHWHPLASLQPADPQLRDSLQHTIAELGDLLLDSSLLVLVFLQATHGRSCDPSGLGFVIDDNRG